MTKILSLFIEVSRYLHARLARRSFFNILKRSDSDFGIEDSVDPFPGVVIFESLCNLHAGMT